MSERGKLLNFLDSMLDDRKQFLLLTFGVSALGLIAAALSISHGKKKTKRLPPGPKGWPIHGELSLRRILGMETKQAAIITQNF